MNENPYQSPDPAEARKQANPSKWKVSLVGLLAVIGILGILVALLLPASRGAPLAARRTSCANNLKHIMLGLHNYHDKHGVFPPAWIADSEGNRLHSWRALILPFVDQQQLFDSIDFTKPWNDPANAKAFNTEVAMYCCPSILVEPSKTNYLANVTASGLLAPPHNGVSPKDELKPLADKLPWSQINAVIEFPEEVAVHWMSPYDADDKMMAELENSDLRNPHSGDFNVGHGDGSVENFAVERWKKGGNVNSEQPEL